jgi:hypothetical protein
LPAGLSPAEAEPALLHELAHVKRGDLLLGALTGLVGALYWFHPLVRLAVRRLADLRELCCDRTVARRIGAGLADYRQALLDYAARRHGGELAGLSFVGGSCLLARLTALERAERDRPRARRFAAVLVALTTFGCAAVVGPPAERRAQEMARIISRPPGCLQLRYLIMERMARERRVDPSPPTPLRRITPMSRTLLLRCPAAPDARRPAPRPRRNSADPGGHRQGAGRSEEVHRAGRASQAARTVPRHLGQ